MAQELESFSGRCKPAHVVLARVSTQLDLVAEISETWLRVASILNPCISHHSGQSCPRMGSTLVEPVIGVDMKGTWPRRTSSDLANNIRSTARKPEHQVAARRESEVEEIFPQLVRVLGPDDHGVAVVATEAESILVKEFSPSLQGQLLNLEDRELDGAEADTIALGARSLDRFDQAFAATRTDELGSVVSWRRCAVYASAARSTTGGCAEMYMAT